MSSSPDPALPPVVWRKSSYSTGQNDCVEVARDGAMYAIRDSRNPSGSHLAFTAHVWKTFTGSIKNDAQQKN
jgi:hypothetical protein